MIARYYKELGKKVLIIYPPVIEEHWKKTLEKVGLKRSDVEWLSRGMLQKSDFDYEKYQGVDLIIVDEAHHFRVSKPKSNRRENLENIGKINPNSHILLITATPINISLLDFTELLKLFVKGNYKERFETEGILAKIHEIERNVKAKEITDEVIEKLNELIRKFTIRIEWPDIIKYFPEVPAGHRVDPGGRFVEQEDLGGVYQGANKTKLLLHPSGQLPGQSLLELLHPEGLQEGTDPFIANLFGNLENVGIKADILVDRQILVKAEPLGHVAQVLFGQVRVGSYVDSIDDRRSPRRGHDACQKAQNGGFSGPVRPDQSKNLPLEDGKGEILDSKHPGKVLEEVPGFDHDPGRGIHGGATLIAASAGSPGTSSWVGL